MTKKKSNTVFQKQIDVQLKNYKPNVNTFSYIRVYP